MNSQKLPDNISLEIRLVSLPVPGVVEITVRSDVSENVKTRHSFTFEGDMDKYRMETLIKEALKYHGLDYVDE